MILLLFLKNNSCTMRRLIVLFSFLIPIVVYAQYTPREIKKYKIRKITTLSITHGNEQIQKDEIWYDENGNDTAQYRGVQLYMRTKYEYNEKGQPVKRIRYKPDGNEMETAIY